MEKILFFAKKYQIYLWPLAIIIFTHLLFAINGKTAPHALIIYGIISFCFGLHLLFNMSLDNSSYFIKNDLIRTIMDIAAKISILVILFSGMTMAMIFIIMLPMNQAANPRAIDLIASLHAINSSAIICHITIHLFLWTIYSVKTGEIIQLNKRLYYEGELFILAPFKQYHLETFSSVVPITIKDLEIECLDSSFKVNLHTYVDIYEDLAKEMECRELDYPSFVRNITRVLEGIIPQDALNMTTGQFMTCKMEPIKVSDLGLPVLWSGQYGFSTHYELYKN